ncbi:hypothetical protein B0H19DRAFT_1079317 [Mycena capillaripes]|nr:hypothetical protein B0H19DRAFT_1079317 [Mycena capillaripes]
MTGAEDSPTFDEKPARSQHLKGGFERLFIAILVGLVARKRFSKNLEGKECGKTKGRFEKAALRCCVTPHTEKIGHSAQLETKEKEKAKEGKGTSVPEFHSIPSALHDVQHLGDIRVPLYGKTRMDPTVREKNGYRKEREEKLTQTRDDGTEGKGRLGISADNGGTLRAGNPAQMVRQRSKCHWLLIATATTRTDGAGPRETLLAFGGLKSLSAQIVGLSAITETVLVNRSEISELKYFGLHNEFNLVGTCNKQQRLLNMDIVEASAGQTYATSLQNDQKIVMRRWDSSYPDGLYHKTREDMWWEPGCVFWAQRELGSEMRDYVYDDFKNLSGGSTGGSQVCKAVLGYRVNKSGTPRYAFVIPK